MELLLRGTTKELGSPRAEKVLTTAKYASIPVTCKEMSLFDLKNTITTPFAKSLVLSFQTHHHVYTSNAMMRTIARLAPASGLLGNSDGEDAIVDSWLSFIWTALDVQLAALEQNESRGQPVQMIQSALGGAFSVLDAHLNDLMYMIGNNVTLVDISLAITLKHITERDEILKPYTNLSRWFKLMIDTGIVKLQ